MSKKYLILTLALGIFNMVAPAASQLPCDTLLTSKTTAFGEFDTRGFRRGEVARQSELISEHLPLVVQFKANSAYGSTLTGSMSWAFDEVSGSWRNGKFEVTARNREKASRVVRFFDNNSGFISDVRVIRSPETWRSYALPQNAWIPKSTGSSPGPEESQILRDTFVAIWPTWAKSASPVALGSEINKNTFATAIPAPKSQVADLNSLLERMGSAKSYLHGLT